MTGRVLDATPDGAADWVCGLLTEAIGATCPEPTAVAVTSWGTDPYSLGAYSHIPPGAAPADADLLGEPLHGRLLFAGEHTQSARLVYTDGAMASGIREAKRLLQQAHVRLGRRRQRVCGRPHRLRLMVRLGPDGAGRPRAGRTCGRWTSPDAL